MAIWEKVRSSKLRLVNRSADCRAAAAEAEFGAVASMRMQRRVRVVMLCGDGGRAGHKGVAT